MTKPWRPDAQSFAQFMAGLPREEIEGVNELNRKEALEQHKAFRDAFKAGCCSFCGAARELAYANPKADGPDGRRRRQESPAGARIGSGR
jgi:hypothetical protein